MTPVHLQGIQGAKTFDCALSFQYRLILKARKARALGPAPQREKINEVEQCAVKQTKQVDKGKGVARKGNGGLAPCMCLRPRNLGIWSCSLRILPLHDSLSLPPCLK